MANDLVVADMSSIEPMLVARATEVLDRIMFLRGNLMDTALELGKLLVEARDNDYHVVYGYGRFGDWVEQADLGIGPRNAYYLMMIVDRAEALGIPEEQLRKIKQSKLKEILSLKEADPETIKALLEKAETASLDEIKKDVAIVKIAQGAEPYVYITLKMPLTVKEEIVDAAFERARKLYGNTINNNGEQVDIPDWKCLELCCVSMLNEQIEEQERFEDRVWEHQQ